MSLIRSAPAPSSPHTHSLAVIGYYKDSVSGEVSKWQFPKVQLFAVAVDVAARGAAAVYRRIETLLKQIGPRIIHGGRSFWFARDPLLTLLPPFFFSLIYTPSFNNSRSEARAEGGEAAPTNSRFLQQTDRVIAIARRDACLMKSSNIQRE